MLAGRAHGHGLSSDTAARRISLVPRAQRHGPPCAVTEHRACTLAREHAPPPRACVSPPRRAVVAQAPRARVLATGALRPIRRQRRHGTAAVCAVSRSAAHLQRHAAWSKPRDQLYLGGADRPWCFSTPPQNSIFAKEDLVVANFINKLFLSSSFLFAHTRSARSAAIRACTLQCASRSIADHHCRILCTPASECSLRLSTRLVVHERAHYVHMPGVRHRYFFAVRVKEKCLET